MRFSCTKYQFDFAFKMNLFNSFFESFIPKRSRGNETSLEQVSSISDLVLVTVCIKISNTKYCCCAVQVVYSDVSP